MSLCPGCGSSYRSGALVTLLDQTTGPRQARVCGKCERRAVKIVAPLLAPVVKQASPARSDDVARAIRQLTTYAKMARASGFDERAEALDSAIHLPQGGTRMNTDGCTCAIPHKQPRDHHVTCPVFRRWAATKGPDAFDIVALHLWTQQASRFVLVGALTRCSSYGRMIVLPGDPDEVGAALGAVGLPVRYIRQAHGRAHVETIVVVSDEPLARNDGSPSDA